MLDFITHIGLITVISWCLSELWDMPGQAIGEYKRIKKAQERELHRGQ